MADVEYFKLGKLYNVSNLKSGYFETTG